MLRFLCNLADEKEKSLPFVSKTVRLPRLTDVLGQQAYALLTSRA